METINLKDSQNWTTVVHYDTIDPWENGVSVTLFNCNEKNIKSTIRIGNINIYVDQKFNRFQRWMMRKCLGLRIYEGRFPHGDN